MDISIGLPNAVEHPGPLLTEWAKRAEERGFSSLGTIDRIVYPSYDTITSLAAAAGATSRINLISGVLLATLYQPVWLAKAAASAAKAKRMMMFPEPKELALGTSMGHPEGSGTGPDFARRMADARLVDWTEKQAIPTVAVPSDHATDLVFYSNYLLQISIPRAAPGQSRIGGPASIPQKTPHHGIYS